MKIEKIDLAETDCFQSSFLEYIDSSNKLDRFYNRKPEINQFKDQSKSKIFTSNKRETLVSVLKEQYGNIDRSDKVENSINSLLEENTYTITTGHQLNIFTGPLYFIYKIVTVINACERLNSEYPDRKFVPVYWMASEDHDFDEISYFRYEGKKYSWKSEQQGAVGRFDPKELKTLLEEFPAKVDVFEKAYLDSANLAEAVRYYVNELMGKYGVIVLDADHPLLKAQFRNVIESDLFDNEPEKQVVKTTAELEQLGFKTQVHARKINFFYLEDNLRTRIERTGDIFSLVDNDRTFTEDEIRKLIQDKPERFSPNVILRPLYQETILPNLAYIGGPAEVVYWLQLKGIFDHFDTEFPVLMPRNFGLVMSAHHYRKWNKTGLSTIDMFKPAFQLAREITMMNSENELRLNGKSESVDDVFTEIKKQAEKIDVTLGPMVEAETVRMRRSLEKIESKMMRAEKRKMSDRIGQVESVKNSLFPNGNLQERTDNFLNFYLEDPGFIEKLVDNFDAFDFRFHVLSYE